MFKNIHRLEREKETGPWLECGSRHSTPEKGGFPQRSPVSETKYINKCKRNRVIKKTCKDEKYKESLDTVYYNAVFELFDF